MSNQFSTYQLGDVAEIIAGGDKPKVFSLEKKAPVRVPVLANAEKNNGLLGYTDNARIFEPAVTVAARGSNVGFVAVRKEPFFPVVRLLSLIPKKDHLDVDYLFYNLKQNRKTGTGSGQPQITIPDISSKTISLPPISVQKKVAEVLSVLDQKIELNNRINAELEAMAKTLYDYWFVQFDFPDANGKPYKTSGGKMVYNPTLKREIPEGWNDGRIGDIIGKAPQATKIPAKEFKENGKVPVIDQSQTYICGFTDDETGTIKPKPAHVIFGDHTRAVKLVNFDYARGADGTQVLVAKSEEVPSYLLYQIVSDIDLSSYGYARHYKFLKESKCVIPKADTSQLYQITVESWYEAIKNNVFQNYELQRLRDWLLPMLMNGQVTVK